MRNYQGRGLCYGLCEVCVVAAEGCMRQVRNTNRGLNNSFYYMASICFDESRNLICC